MFTQIRKYPVKTTLVGLASIGVALSATSAAAAIGSNVYIDANETFVLGGKQPGAFAVRGQNKGSVRVEIYAEDDEKRVLLTTLEPGERFNADFAQGEGALLRNTSSAERAHVKVRITGTTSNLGMGYRGWEDAQ